MCEAHAAVLILTQKAIFLCQHVIVDRGSKENPTPVDVSCEKLWIDQRPPGVVVDEEQHELVYRCGCNRVAVIEKTKEKPAPDYNQSS